MHAFNQRDALNIMSKTPTRRNLTPQFAFQSAATETKLRWSLHGVMANLNYVVFLPFKVSNLTFSHCDLWCAPFVDATVLALLPLLAASFIAECDCRRVNFEFVLAIIFWKFDNKGCFFGGDLY